MFDRRLGTLARTQPALLLLTGLFGMVAGVMIVSQAALLSLVINVIFFEGGTLEAVRPAILLLLPVILLRAACVAGERISAGRLAIRLKADLRRRLLSHLVVLGPTFTRDERTGELTTVALEGIESLDAYFSKYLPQLILSILVPLIILIAVLRVDLLSALVLFLTAPLIPLFMVLIGRLAESVTRRQWLLLARMSAFFLDVLQGLKTLKTLGQSKSQAGNIATISEGYAATTLQVLRVAFLSALVLELVATLSTAVVAVEIGLRLLSGRLAFQQALFILVLAPEFYQPLRNLGARFHAGMEGISAADRIFSLLVTPAPIVLPERPTPIPVTWRELSFESVSHAYDDGERPSLHQVSFEIRQGETLALVGPTGAGKSTLASLLLRYLDPDSGRIRLDGKDLRDFRPADWRDEVAWVPQTPYLFSATIDANIRLGRPEASRDQVREAARQAQIDDFIESLPDRYGTMIGERGQLLSGGQAQRLALARAFLKDAPFIILDEPTANLDPETESRLREAMDLLIRSRTALVIAHRLPTVYRADRILVLSQGVLIETGTHAALVSAGGFYSRLVGAYGGGEAS